MKEPKYWIWAAEHDDTIIGKIILRLSIIPCKLEWRWIRLQCWYLGCDMRSGVGWNMPEDCVEWWCERCGAEGINHVQMYGKPPYHEGLKERVAGWMRGQRRRIKQQLCRHTEIYILHVCGYAGNHVWVHCKKCHKFLGSKNLEEQCQS